ncbi:MAG: urease accessory protein UreE [Rhodobacteraceae bacterium]|nr:MAG: urease accessory protein UreE [Paracoccaceae bacterium]
MLVARAVAGSEASNPFDVATLDYDARYLRRAVIRTTGGREVLVDLAEAQTLRHGARLVLEDGRAIAVEAAPEALAEVRAETPLALARLAWHLGNRHLPTQIEADRLLIRRDHVIEHMLAHRGARVTPVEAPFDPEGGAYGDGRTHGHAHGHAHEHDHHHADAAQAHGADGHVAAPASRDPR